MMQEYRKGVMNEDRTKRKQNERYRGRMTGGKEK
jgi:hypothetical protein